MPSSPLIVAAALLALLPYLAAAFFPARTAGCAKALPVPAQILCPAFLSIPYVLVSLNSGTFSWPWFTLYAMLPVAIAATMSFSARSANRSPALWPEILILAILGLAVDLRWFERAWPPHLTIFNKMLLLDAGIYAFLFLRNLDGVGFDLRLRLRDLAVGLREFFFYLPVALALGLTLGFLHLHPFHLDHGRILAQFAGAWLFTFFFIAVPEELFFRGWLQNLLERRIGRLPALIATALLFGLSHFNKRAGFFNWRYVLLAAIAGIFYGRGWRQQRRVGASAVTHATVDSVWSLWLR